MLLAAPIAGKTGDAGTDNQYLWPEAPCRLP